jgi:RNA polymerase-binding transcription factor DksA
MKTKRHLNAAQRRELEAELRRERALLLRTVARSESGRDDDGAVVPSPSAVPGGDLSVGLGVALDLRAQAALDTITRALARLEDGTYGSCLTCGDVIPYGRLIALPATEHCVGCRSAA